MPNTLTNISRTLRMLLCEPNGDVVIRGSHSDKVAIQQAIIDLEAIATTLPLQLKAIQLRTGNTLFDAATHEACSRIARFFGETLDATHPDQ